MTVPQYSRVRITSSRFQNEGVATGTIGYVVEIHEDAAGKEYEVEVMDENGHTLALIVTKESELEVLPKERTIRPGQQSPS